MSAPQLTRKELNAVMHAIDYRAEALNEREPKTGDESRELAALDRAAAKLEEAAR